MKGFLFYGFTFFLIFDLYSVNTKILESLDDIDFAVPHLIVDHELDSSTTISLKAYTTKNIKESLAQDDPGSKYKRFVWMSLGYPNLIETKNSDNDQSRIFHFNDEGFFTFVQTLNQDHKNALVRALFNKYSINVNISQILNIPLAYFRCEIDFYDQENLRNLTITGQVDDFDQHPYKLVFKVPSNSNNGNSMLLKAGKSSCNRLRLFRNSSLNSKVPGSSLRRVE